MVILKNVFCKDAVQQVVGQGSGGWPLLPQAGDQPDQGLGPEPRQHRRRVRGPPVRPRRGAHGEHEQ